MSGGAVVVASKVGGGDVVEGERVSGGGDVVEGERVSGGAVVVASKVGRGDGKEGTLKMKSWNGSIQAAFAMIPPVRGVMFIQGVDSEGVRRENVPRKDVASAKGMSSHRTMGTRQRRTQNKPGYMMW